MELMVGWRVFVLFPQNAFVSIHRSIYIWPGGRRLWFVKTRRMYRLSLERTIKKKTTVMEMQSALFRIATLCIALCINGFGKKKCVREVKYVVINLKTITIIPV